MFRRAPRLEGLTEDRWVGHLVVLRADQMGGRWADQMEARRAVRSEDPMGGRWVGHLVVL